MRKKGIILGVCLAMGMMCGCLQETPLTDSEMDVVAEYAAKVLLESDSIYHSVLLSQEKVEEILNPTPTLLPTLTVAPTSAPMAGDSFSSTTGQNSMSSGALDITPLLGDTEETTKQLTQMLGQENLHLSYKGYEVKESLVGNEFYRLEAKEGKQYIILNFEIENQTEKEIENSSLRYPHKDGSDDNAEQSHRD